MFRKAAQPVSAVPIFLHKLIKQSVTSLSAELGAHLTLFRLPKSPRGAVFGLLPEFTKLIGFTLAAPAWLLTETDNLERTILKQNWNCCQETEESNHHRNMETEQKNKQTNKPDTFTPVWTTAATAQNRWWLLQKLN